MGWRKDFDALLGKTIVAVHTTAGRDAIGFVMASGETLLFWAEGDCCSRSWFEHVTGLVHLLGAEITGIKDRPMGEAIETLSPEQKRAFHDRELKLYGWTIMTTRGYFDVEMRNSSNGYYGGYIGSVTAFDPSDYPKLEADF